MTLGRLSSPNQLHITQQLSSLALLSVHSVRVHLQLTEKLNRLTTEV